MRAGGGTGEWWLTDAGRPALAAGVSDRDAGVHTAELLRALAGGSACAAALALAVDAMDGAPTVGARPARCGGAALRRGGARAARDDGPRPARGTRPRRVRPRGSAGRRRAVADDPCGATLSPGTSTPISRTRSHARRPVSGDGCGRLASAAVAPGSSPAASAAVVLAAGLLWPTGAGGPATADAGAAPDAAAGSPSATAGDPARRSRLPLQRPPTPRVRVRPATDLVATTDRLLLARTACGGDEACLSGVVVDPASVMESGVIDLDPSQRVDDAARRLRRSRGAPGRSRRRHGEALSSSSSCSRDDRWLLRDVHVAKQP